MNRQAGDDGASRFQVTGFSGGGWAVTAARVLVLDMVLWPGLLFVGVVLLAGWQARHSPPALAVVALATLLSVLVGVRQWDVMLRAVLAGTADGPATSARETGDSGEGSPRLTGRGSTEC